MSAERGPSGTGHDTAPEPFVCASCGNSFFDNDGCPDCTIQHAPRVTEAAPARRWSDCPVCAEFYDANRDAVLHAAASVGIEHGLTANAALALYMKWRHRDHA